MYGMCLKRHDKSTVFPGVSLLKCIPCLRQESLGGNAQTLMLAAISPADYNFEETLGTLRSVTALVLKGKVLEFLDVLVGSTGHCVSCGRLLKRYRA